jgi:hypothetical protein
MGSDSFWSAIMNADKTQFDRLVRRAALIEAKFGVKAMGNDSFLPAAMMEKDTEFDLLEGRAEQIEKLSARAMACRCFWNVVLRSDEGQWPVVMARVEEVTKTAPESLAADGFWQLLLKRLTNPQFALVMGWAAEIKASKHSLKGEAPALSGCDSCWTQLAKLAVIDTPQEAWAKMKSVFEAIAASAANQDVWWSVADRPGWPEALVELEELMRLKRKGMTSINKPKTNAPNRQVLTEYLRSHPADHEIWSDPSAAATAAPLRTAPIDGFPAEQPRKAAKRTAVASPSSSQQPITCFFPKGVL